MTTVEKISEQLAEAHENSDYEHLNNVINNIAPKGYNVKFHCGPIPIDNFESSNIITIDNINIRFVKN